MKILSHIGTLSYLTLHIHNYKHTNRLNHKHSNTQIHKLYKQKNTWRHIKSFKKQKYKSYSERKV